MRAGQSEYLAKASAPFAGNRSGLLHRFDQVTAASHFGPCLIEVGNEQLEGRGVETVAQRCHVFELIERVVDRWVATAPEAPAFLGTEFIHRQRQMVCSIPFIEFRALALVRHLRSNHEIDFARLHVRSSCKKWPPSRGTMSVASK